jgi:hypothetical protein
MFRNKSDTFRRGYDSPTLFLGANDACTLKSMLHHVIADCRNLRMRGSGHSNGIIYIQSFVKISQVVQYLTRDMCIRTAAIRLFLSHSAMIYRRGLYPTSVIFITFSYARGSVFGWGAMLQAGRLRVRVPMRLLDFFSPSLPYPSRGTMAVGSTQPLTEKSTRTFPGGRRRPAGA